MCVRMNWVNEKKPQSLFWEPTHLLQGVVRDVHVVQAIRRHWRQSSVSEVTVGRKRMLGQGLELVESLI